MEHFTEDEDGLPRTWGPKVSIQAVTRQARRSAAECLALLTVKRRGLNEVGSCLPAPCWGIIPWARLMQPSPARADGQCPLPGRLMRPHPQMRPAVRCRRIRAIACLTDLHGQAAERKVEVAVLAFAQEAGRSVSMRQPASMSRAQSLSDPPDPSTSGMDMVGLEEWPGVPQGQVRPPVHRDAQAAHGTYDQSSGAAWC